jgi:L-asparagine oxygenase
MTTTTVATHPAPRQVTSPRFDLGRAPSYPISSPEFVTAAGHSSRLLPAVVHDALVDFTDDPGPAGALLISGLPLGEVPATPPTPTSPTGKDHATELLLLTVARRLGHPVGYRPEHGGDLVQNIVPVRQSAQRQISTSSKVTLMFHTEAAFHPHRPRYLLLLCLRGDEAAATTLASARALLPHLTEAERAVLFEPRFRTAVDESYLHGAPNRLGPPLPVFRGDPERPSMVFDADLMVGVDAEADTALRHLAQLVGDHHLSVVLRAGDLLVVDNDVAVHGRTPFTPRFDGTDRWLQRAFVVTDLGASAGEREGRVIVTDFASAPLR